MNNITYKVNKLEVIPSQNQFVNVIKTIHYSVVISEEGYSAEIIDSIKLNDPVSSEFIAYDDLPEETVVNWIKVNIDIEKVENILKQKLYSIKNPTVLKNPPWIN